MIRINLKKDGNIIGINAYRGENIADALRKSGNDISMPCAGKGKCGKCIIRISDKAYPFTDADIRLLGEERIKEGERLLCQMRAFRDIEIELINDNKKMDIIESFEDKYIDFKGKENGYAICVDIGTTTVAAILVSLCDGKIRKRFGKINSQASFGADVISRLEASIKGRGPELKRAVTNDIRECIGALTENSDKNEIKKIFLAGNTAMTYLLLGRECKEIAESPFICDFKKAEVFGYNEIFESNELNCSVFVVNCLSAYVGGDITSGAVFCDLLKRKNTLLIDLGTNAEMAVFNGEKLYVTSAAAGPAFEGGCISCGTGGVKGAICRAELKNGIWSYETIGRESAVGVCGSGLIDIIAQLIEKGIIDKSGLLEDKYFNDGVKIGRSVTLTQNDIRQFQLAKAAVRAGIKILLKKAGIVENEIKCIFMAGGFGFRLNEENILISGLLPSEFKGKIITVGNSSLGGLRDILLGENKDYLNRLSRLCFEVRLADEEDFNSCFMEEMDF